MLGGRITDLTARERDGVVALRKSKTLQAFGCNLKSRVGMSYSNLVSTACT